MADITVMYGSALKVTQLHYVRAVADHGSFSRAAASLGVTQPALSNGVAALEGVLGGALFERTSRGAPLTPLGTQLLPQINRILGSIDSLLGEARSATGRPGEPLRMGVSPLIHPSLVARAFEASRQGGLTLTEQNLTGLRQALERKELDVILVPAVSPAPGCQSREIDAEPMRYLGSGVAASTGGGRPIEIDELAVDKQLLVAGECGLTAFVQALFDENGATLQRYPGGAHSYRNLVDWARLGLGGAILPESRLDEAVGAGRPLVQAGKPIEIRYEALWLAQSANAPLVEGLLDAMLENTEPAEPRQGPG